MGGGEGVTRREALKMLGRDISRMIMGGDLENLETVKKVLKFRVTVDSERCTVCGACAYVCHTNAFKMSIGGESYLLLLNESRCDGCMKCVEACPEKAIEVEPAEEVEDQFVRVASSPVARCKVCGRPIGPSKVLESVARRLREAGLDKFAEMVYICDECKARMARAS